MDKSDKDINDLLKGCFINIDKPEGPTSHDVDLWMRRILGVEKTGHFGTLDPMVTGVLPIAVGKATRLLQYLKSGKEYVGVMNIHENISLKDVRKAIKQHFTGKIKQTPPKKSRVKRVEREREIYDFKILENNGRDFLFSVKCEAGTYIRKLVHDLGEKLGCGAHMAELRRTKAGVFEEKNIINLYDLVKAYEEFQGGNSDRLIREMLIPKEEVIKKCLKGIDVKAGSLERLSHGSPIFKEDLLKRAKLKKEEKVAVLSEGRLIMVAKAFSEGNIIAKPEAVLI